MELENVLYETKENIAYITVNRPDKLNALNSRTMTELMDVFAYAAAEPQIKAVILTGEGEKSFVAGADIAELAELDPLGGKRYSERGQEIFNFIEKMTKPVIAAVNGFALGGGCELAMACHIRIASENAKFGQPEVTLGLIPGYGGTQRLTRLVGKGKAMELVLTGTMIDAEEACRIGLANRVVNYAGFIEKEKDGVKKQVPDLVKTKSALLEVAEKMAKSIAVQAPVAVNLAIEAVNRGLEMTLAEGENVESDLFGMVMATDDFHEGTSAFLEKRKPEWKGR
jgi:enoyl-CoA hydratase